MRHNLKAAAVSALADEHQNFIFDTARGIGCELDVPVGAERADGLDQANRADGDEILNVDAGVFKAPRDVDHKPQIALDEPGPRGLVASGGLLQEGLLLLRGKRRRENVAAADVHDLPRLYEAELLQNKFQFHPISPPINA